jgi:Na+/H+-translocating membrane pyrophosphatase
MDGAGHGAAAVLFALWLAHDVLRGTLHRECEIAGMIFEGASILSRQYRTIAILAVVTAVAVACSWAASPRRIPSSSNGQVGFGQDEVGAGRGR